MTIIFKAKTTDAYHFKILIELLTNNIKVAHFEIDQEGIKLCMMDTHRKILVDLNLLAENFNVFKLVGKKMYLGINLAHLHRLVRSIKKKDSLQLFIDDKNLTKLGIRFIPKENNRITTSYVTIQMVQEIAIGIPTGYVKPIIISSSDFSKMNKDLSSIGNMINVSSRNFRIKFSCETGGILERNVDFGEIDDDLDDNDNTKNINDYNQNFLTEQLSRITKISGLSSQIKIFPGKPLLFRSKIGNIGEISLYIKSKEEVDAEERIEEEYESD